MKKVLVYLLFISISVLILFTITGCNLQEESIEENFNETTVVDNNKKNETEEDKYANVVSVDNIDFKFTENGKYFDLSYKYPFATIVNNFKDSTTLSYLKGKDASKLVFRISMNKLKQTDLKNQIKSNNYSKVGNKTINNIAWEVYTDNEKNKIYTYLTNNGEVYIIKIESDNGIDKIEQEFMNNVKMN